MPPRLWLTDAGPHRGVMGGHCTRFGGGELPASCWYTAGSAKVVRRDADETLEVLGEVALICETDTRRDLGQGKVLVGVQELLRPRDAARDDILVRRHPGGRFELAREVVGAAVGGRSQLRQGQAGVKVVLDILQDNAEGCPAAARRPAHVQAGGAPGPGEAAGRPGRWLATRRRADCRLLWSTRRRLPPAWPGGAAGPRRRAVGLIRAPGRGQTPRRQPGRPAPAPGR